MAGVSLLPLATRAQEQEHRYSPYVSVDYSAPPRFAQPPVAPAPSEGEQEGGGTLRAAVSNNVVTSGAPKNEQPVDFAADTLQHDETGQAIIARGNVEMVQAGRILTADEVRYDLVSDTVTASGNVVLTYDNGDVYTADKLDLTDDMKTGFVEKLYAVLEDGSRFWAEQGTRSDGTVTVMDDAIYTPCEPCKNNPDASPPWRLRARTVTHDQEDARISYRDARFELFGVPVAYTPYFSHPDGTVEQKSGLLTPRFGLDSDLGASYAQSYYWAIAPDRDLTVGAKVFSDTNPMLTGEYRQRFNKGAMQIAGGVTYSDRTENSGGRKGDINDEWRGHLFAEGEYNINDNWRAGIRSELVSDDQYARQYDVSNEDVLETELYAERFDDRDYAVVRAMAFQDIRVSARQREQPTILPEVQASFIGSPNDTLGGRWSMDLSMLGLERDGNGQDMVRGSVQTGWQRRDVTPFGLVSTVDLSLRGDAYNVRDRDVAATPGRDDEVNTVRGFAQANWQASMPFVRHFDESGSQMVIEPIVALTSGTNIDVDDDIPNEDSQDVFLDAPKLFEPNRFAGYDRIEDGNRVTYGMRTALYGASGWDTGVFVGQSYRLSKEPALFAEGSGLSERRSDLVGSVHINAHDRLNLNYRFQLDNETFSSRRHEVSARTKMGPVSLNTRYFYSTPLVRTDLNEAREQIYFGGHVDFDEEWSAFAAAQYDFAQDEGWRKAKYGITYTGQCYTLGATLERDFTRSETGNSDTALMVRIGLKNLGEFETSGLSLGDDDE